MRRYRTPSRAKYTYGQLLDYIGQVNANLKTVVSAQMNPDRSCLCTNDKIGFPSIRYVIRQFQTPVRIYLARYHVIDLIVFPAHVTQLPVLSYIVATFSFPSSLSRVLSASSNLNTFSSPTKPTSPVFRNVTLHGPLTSLIKYSNLSVATTSLLSSFNPTNVLSNDPL